MAFGTPVVGTTAYSALNGTSVAPTYPASIVGTDQLVLILGMKPSTANSGSVTTPSGWTLRESLTAAGGYGTTLGADTGNTNLYIYTKDTVAGGESGTVTVTVATNNVCWANITRVPTGGGTISYGSADGQRTTTPTSPLSVALTDGSPATAFAAGDFAIWAMCIPTDVTTPAQFSAHTLTSSGVTFNATAELIEPDSGTGNDIGGYVAYVTVATGSAGGAPTVGATLAGTLTNVRGPLALLRMREAPNLQPTRLDNTQDFFSPTVSPGAVTLSPALYTNDQTFFAHEVVQAGGPQDLQPGLYTNTQTFYTQAVSSTYALTPAIYDNAQTFYGPTVSAGPVTLLPGLYGNLQTFYVAAVVPGAIALTAARLDNAQTFYGPTVTQGGPSVNLQPPLLTNAQTFYAHTLTAQAPVLSAPLLTNAQTFFGGQVNLRIGPAPAPEINTNQFFAPTVNRGAVTLVQASRFDNAQFFYPPFVGDAPQVDTGRNIAGGMLQNMGTLMNR